MKWNFSQGKNFYNHKTDPSLRQPYGKLEPSIVHIANVPVEMAGPFLSRNWLLMAESQGDPSRQI